METVDTRYIDGIVLDSRKIDNLDVMLNTIKTCNKGIS